MADIITNDQYYKDIADAIRNNTGVVQDYLPEEMASGIDTVFAQGLVDGESVGFDRGYSNGYDEGFVDGIDSGYSDGLSQGYDEGFVDGEELGQQLQYDQFWDILQNNGKRTDYERAFCNWQTAGAIFKPKYNIKPTGSILQMFYKFRTYISFPDICKSQGIEMDFSQVTNFQDWLYNTAVYRVGVIDCSSVTGTLTYIFNNASSLKFIDKWIVHEGITTYNNCFANSALLESIVIEGVIAGTGFNISGHTKLTRESLLGIPLTKEEAADLPSTNVVELNGNYYYGGIIPALKDYSGTSTTKTITLGATNLAKLSDTEKAIATDKGWTLA